MAEDDDDDDDGFHGEKEDAAPGEDPPPPLPLPPLMRALAKGDAKGSNATKKNRSMPMAFVVWGIVVVVDANLQRYG